MGRNTITDTIGNSVLQRARDDVMDDDAFMEAWRRGEGA